MKSFNIRSTALFIMFLMLFTGCSVIGGIFEAGMWVGIIGVVLVVVFVIWIIRKLL